MQSQGLPCDNISGSNSEDRASAAMLAVGGADGVPALGLRHWPTEGDAAMRCRRSSPGCWEPAASA